MRRHIAGVVTLVALAPPLLAAPVAAAHASATAPATPPVSIRFHLDGRQLDEISGIAAGIRSPRAVYVENDSGDSARFFALDARTGAIRAQYAVPGATNVDWEDIAVAPVARGTPSVWLADIGDNDAQRKQIEIYRVDEPQVPMRGSDEHRVASRPDVWRLRYPDGQYDAEALAVSSVGVPYIVTKSLTGASEVFAAAGKPGAQTLRKIGEIRFHPTGTPGPFSPFGEVTVTGADISRSGTRLVVRTYTDAYLWTVRDGDVAAALRTEPVRIALPEQPQGEGICFDDDQLLIDSEGVGSAVYSVPIPPVVRSPVSAEARTPSGSAPAVTTAAANTHGHGGSWWLPGLVFAGALALLAAVGTARRRRQEQSERGRGRRS